MTLPRPTNLLDMIHPDTQWDSWMQFMRGHPTFLRDLLDRIPQADNHFDALHRTRTIAWWARQQGDQLCQAQYVQDNASRTYWVGVAFPDNPYATQRGPVSLGSTHYADPYCEQHPISWEMDDNKLVAPNGTAFDPSRIIQASDNDPPHPGWLALVEQAERQWFATAENAPVVVVAWSSQEKLSGMPGHQVVDLWDATEEVLAMTPMERRSIEGYRKRFSDYPTKLGRPGPLVHARREDGEDEHYTLKLHIHAASPALMAWRRASALDEATQDNERTPTASRRL